jgi:hypothetical protein
MNLNYEATYKIRPLKWELSSADWQTTSTIFGLLKVVNFNGGWGWTYCFDEFYDGEFTWYESEKECKLKAEEFYLSRLKELLIEL